MQIRHIGRGTFSAFDDSGNRIGPVGTRAGVEAWVAEQGLVSAEAVEPEPEPALGVGGAPMADAQVKAYERMLAGAVRRDTDALGKLVFDALAPAVGEDIARSMVSRMEPILRDPTNQSRRRRIMRA